MAFCAYCGARISDGSAFCGTCGKPVYAQSAEPQPSTRNTAANPNPAGIRCPRCGSGNIHMQIFQEQLGNTTVSKTNSMYKEKGHGLIWWLFIGWWWWMVDIFLWICFFPLKLIQVLTKKEKYKGKSTTVTHTQNHTVYKNMCVCGNCGHNWVASITRAGK